MKRQTKNKRKFLYNLLKEEEESLAFKTKISKKNIRANKKTKRKKKINFFKNRNIHKQFLFNKKIFIILILAIFTFIISLLYYFIFIHKKSFIRGSSSIPITSENNKIYFSSTKKSNGKRIGIVGYKNEQNFGNFMVKFSMCKKLKEYNFNPIIISIENHECNIDFLNKTCELKILKNNFSELNESDYDIMMVNSDQTWGISKFLYDIGFLKFAENWTIPKFVYGASLGRTFWPHPLKVDNIAQKFLKKFTGISVREIGIVNKVENHWGIKPEFVIDPTFLIDKNYYLDAIKDYKKDLNFSKKYLMVYQLDDNKRLKNFIREASEKLNYDIYNYNLSDEKFVENFIFAINNTEAMITDSYHGTVFSIIFNKSFISFVNKGRGNDRFFSLRKIFKLGDRIIDSFDSPNIDLLLSPLNINQTLFNSLKNSSINFLEKNLGF